MSARLLDGNAIAAAIRREVAAEVAYLPAPPCLGVVLVGDDPASHVYVRNKERACAEVGIRTVEHRLPAAVTEAHVVAAVEEMNADPGVHGILTQLPLPRHVDRLRVFDAIDPAKDVDVFTPLNTGKLAQHRSPLVPCTPGAVVEILRRSDIRIAGQRVAIVNRSPVVGQPLANMLLQNHEFANATVTVCHEHTRDMRAVLREADIIVTAVGRPEWFRLTADMVRPGATVVDVAIIRQDGKLFGDADPDVREVAGAITPVPGGVGPVTVCMLLRNTVTAYRNLEGLD